MVESGGTAGFAVVRRAGLLVVAGLTLAGFGNVPRIHSAWWQLRSGKLVLDVQSDSTCAVQVLHDMGSGFVGSGVQWLSLAGDGRSHRFEFALPDAAIVRLGLGVDGGGDRPRLVVHHAVLARQSPSGETSEMALSASATDFANGAENDAGKARLVPLVSLPLPEPVAPRALSLADVGTLARRFTPSLLLHALLLSILLALGLRERGARAFMSSHALRAALLFVVCALTIIMTQVSRFDASPDEALHVLTAHYYDEHWLPPGALDPDLPKYLHGAYGATYLLTTPAEATYLLAAKFVQLLGVPGTLDAAFRLFNLTLLFLLVVVLVTRPRLDPAHVLVLMVTPQLWYVFSYFNGDALPLCASLILAWQLGDPASVVRRYLDAPVLRAHTFGGVLLGVLTGLLILSKSNYLAFLAFLLFVPLWRFATAARERRSLELEKWAVAAAVALVCVAPFFLADLVRNGLHKADLVLFLRERYGLPSFRPSAVARGDVTGQQWMAARGVPLSALFREHNWHVLSLKSFFGVYGYMSVALPLYYYGAQVIVAGGTVGALGWLARKQLWQRRILAVVLAAAGCALLVVGASIYNSWTYDLQAQGRYLFPILPVALLAWRLIAEQLPRETLARQRRVLLFVIPVSLLVSGYSFVFCGITGIAK